MTVRIKNLINKAKVIRSLKARIFVLIFLAGMIPALIMRFGMIGNYEEHAVSVRTSDVTGQAQILANHLLTYNYLQVPTSEIINAANEKDQLDWETMNRLASNNPDFAALLKRARNDLLSREINQAGYDPVLDREVLIASIKPA